MATDKTFIVSGFEPKIPAAQKFVQAVDQYIELSARIKALETEAEALKAVILADPQAEEVLNEALKQKLQVFPESETFEISTDVIPKLTKAQIAEVVTISESKLAKLDNGNALVAAFRVPKGVKKAFVKVTALGKDDIAKIAAVKTSIKG